jgi:hypothetical protein
MLTSSVDTPFQSGATLQKQTISYNNLEEPLSVSSYDGSSPSPILTAQTTYSYDDNAVTTTSGIPQHTVVSSNPGNQTSSHVMTASGSTIDTTTAYYDTGVPISTTTTPNGTTQFNYDSTQTFRTRMTLPTPSSGVQLSTSASYDPQSGVQLTSSGMNLGQTTQVIQYDSLLRPVLATLPNGGSIQATYSANRPASMSL